MTAPTQPRPLPLIERELHAARCDVFTLEGAEAEAAAARVSKLSAEYRAHPDEIARRERVKTDADTRFMRTWE